MSVWFGEVRDWLLGIEDSGDGGCLMFWDKNQKRPIAQALLRNVYE
jgi:hypothetical protein